MRTFFHRILGTHTVPLRGESPYLRIWQCGRPTMSTVNDCGYGGKGDGPRAPPTWWQGLGGRTLPPSPNPQEGTMKRRMKMGKRVR
jgi:hypothetical protein